MRGKWSGRPHGGGRGHGAMRMRCPTSFRPAQPAFLLLHGLEMRPPGAVNARCNSDATIRFHVWLTSNVKSFRNVRNLPNELVVKCSKDRINLIRTFSKISKSEKMLITICSINEVDEKRPLRILHCTSSNLLTIIYEAPEIGAVQKYAHQINLERF